MNSWIERKARKMLMAGALAFAVGVPMLACTGAATDDGATDDGGTEEPGGALQTKLKGTWKVKPHQDEMRDLKIIDMALRPNSNVDMLRKKLEPPPNDAEIALFEDVKRKGKNDPEIAFLASIMEMMKGATLTVDDTKWVYQIAEERYEMPYTVDEQTGDTIKVTLSNAPGGTEKHTLHFKTDNEIEVTITEPQEQRLVFVRK